MTVASFFKDSAKVQSIVLIISDVNLPMNCVAGV